ncbi:hypothetical protein DRQ17_07565, partial [bacterium]
VVGVVVPTCVEHMGLKICVHTLFASARVPTLVIPPPKIVSTTRATMRTTTAVTTTHNDWDIPFME